MDCEWFVSYKQIAWNAGTVCIWYLLDGFSAFDKLSTISPFGILGVSKTNLFRAPADSQVSPGHPPILQCPPSRMGFCKVPANACTKPQYEYIELSYRTCNSSSAKTTKSTRQRAVTDGMVPKPHVPPLSLEVSSRA